MYIVQGPPRPPGKPGQDGRDGHYGQAPQLPRGMINVPGVAPAPLDTTGLENSFENLGRTMVDVLAMCNGLWALCASPQAMGFGVNSIFCQKEQFFPLPYSWCGAFDNNATIITYN